MQIFSDHLKEFQFPIYKICFGRIDKQEQICSQKCLSKRFSKVGNKSEVNRLGVKIVEDSGSQLVSRLVFGDKPDSLDGGARKMLVVLIIVLIVIIVMVTFVIVNIISRAN